MTDIKTLFDLQRAAFHRDMLPTAEVRRQRLIQLERMIGDNQDALIAAISEDFGNRSAQETKLIDIVMAIASIRHAKRKLKGWMRPRRLPTALHFLPSRNRLIRQPLGVVGIVAPWNYPLVLAIGPAIGALAAGNRVMIKPSEFTPRFSALLQELVGKSFPPEVMSVVTGGPEVAQAFTELPFDHLFFTGSTSVGRKVAQAAARNLTPVTLELGGKSPAIIDPSADLDRAAGSLAFSKLFNAGQTCVAPDYLLVPAGREEDLAQRIIRAARKLYPTLAGNGDYTSIVTTQHFGRLEKMAADAQLKGASLVTIDEREAVAGIAERKFPLTLVLGATPEMRVMQEEIFGPILPVLTYRTPDEAIELINRGDRPLALYWFGTNSARREAVLKGTLSGGVTINDCLWHVAQEEAPFGGVGASGMGSYHGEWGFRTFSKEKPVFHQSRLSSLPLLRPPYGRLAELMTALVEKIV